MMPLPEWGTSCIVPHADVTRSSRGSVGSQAVDTAEDPKSSEIRYGLPAERSAGEGGLVVSRWRRICLKESSMQTAEGCRSAHFEVLRPHGDYTVVLSSRVRQQLDGAPSIVQGYLAGISAILRIDPTSASTILDIQWTEGEAWTATYALGQGFVTYWVLEAQERVVLLDWVWAG